VASVVALAVRCAADHLCVRGTTVMAALLLALLPCPLVSGLSRRGHVAPSDRCTPWAATSPALECARPGHFLHPDAPSVTSVLSTAAARMAPRGLSGRVRGPVSAASCTDAPVWGLPRQPSEADADALSACLRHTGDCPHLPACTLRMRAGVPRQWCIMVAGCPPHRSSAESLFRCRFRVARDLAAACVSCLLVGYW